MGRNQDALPVFQRVEALSQSTQELATAYNWLGSAYTSLHDLDRAELYDQRALKVFRELDDKKGAAQTLNNLAKVEDNRGNTERALKLYREALAVMPEAEQAATLDNIALIHADRKEYQQAIKLLRQAFEIDHSNGNAHGAARHQIDLGDALGQDKQYAAAKKELLAGLNTIRLVGDKGWEARACLELYVLAATRDNSNNNLDEARQWLGKAEAIYREIGDTAAANRIANQLAGK